MHARIQKRLLDALLSKPLVSNAFRGTLVEAIIAEALEPEWRWCADGWGSFDFEGPNGTGLEVKQSATLQTWHDHDSKRCSPRFDIAERQGYWDAKSRWTDAPGRAAKLYVFAYHPIVEPGLADHRDPFQWDFYVVPAAKLPTQKSMGLSGVIALATPVAFPDLLYAVNECFDANVRSHSRPASFICPKCKQKTGVKIVYGYPGDEMREQAQRNEVALGGCCQPIGAAERQCLNCEHQWNIVRRKSLREE